ncbi:MAG: zinc ribbon domain-containing protein [Lachnospiraceae bacterium]|uniref:zinc ribbon domain-containing protein n=1 Tax=Oribacterium sp. P6A1 TaxID=1410612 RepID=UPI00056818D0|nr:zinc ribbon domain-containing protein [Oribacterium sp. P6A1]MBE6005498.1 zinc ribbon domain-containing protein [Lachnospiraceae bacterium]
MFCTNCGSKISENVSFCPNCGARVKMQPGAPEASSNANFQNVGNNFGAAQGSYNAGQQSSGSGGVYSGTSGGPQEQYTANQQPIGNIGAFGAAQVKYTGVPSGSPSMRNQYSGSFAASADEPMLVQDPSLPEGIFRDSKGAFHWQYELNMIKNPVVLFLIIKIFFGVCFGVGLMLALMVLIEDGDFEDAIRFLLIVTFGIGGLMIVMGVIAYYILVAIKGGRYTVVHSMDENSVQHLQTPAEKDQSRKMRSLLFVMGLLTDNPSSVGLSMGARDEMESAYKDVRKVIASRRHDLIKVNNLLQHNQIYAYPHQYEFVFNYIASHCPNAKIKR